MQNRIEFIDLAKGVCILLVVTVHCGLPLAIPGCLNLRMPLYFVLSGIFFKTYNGFGAFLLKKTNKLLVPFLFFYFIAYIAYYIANWVTPGLIKSDASGIFDVFTQRQYFNGPIWFLICLFWSNIYFYLIQKLVKNDIFKAICIFLICTIGATMGQKGVFLPCMMDVAMTALPFFYIGYLLKQTKLLIPNRFDRYNLLLVLIFWTTSFLMERYLNIGNISFHYNQYHGYLILDIVSATSSVMAVLFLCKSIRKIPFVSYCGRYSIILLCTHHLYYRPLLILLNRIIPSLSIYATAFFTIVLCYISISLCIKYIPMFCAQKDLFNNKNIK